MAEIAILITFLSRETILISSSWEWWAGSIISPRWWWQNVQEQEHFCMTTDNFCFQWMNPEGVKWDLISFQIWFLLADSTSLRNVLKNELIFQFMSPSLCIAALMKSLLLCDRPLGPLPTIDCCSHKYKFSFTLAENAWLWHYWFVYIRG